MQFSDVIGHREIISNLRSMVDNNRMPHAVLFTERPGCGALQLALATISYMFCNSKRDGDSCNSCNQCSKNSRLVHPDLHFAFPINTSTLTGGDKKADTDEFYPHFRELVLSNPTFGESELYKAIGVENKFGNIGVTEATRIMRKLSLSSYEGGIKVMVILFPERMNQEAANKLLKSIEEPQPGTYYFMVSHNPSKIITTILSRCRIVEVPPIGEQELTEALAKSLDLTEEDAAFYARSSGGSYGKALELIRQESEGNENHTIFIRLLELAIAKDMVQMFDIWNMLSGWGKEAQKNFCSDSLELLRKIYMIKLGLEEISYSNMRERESLKSISANIKESFFEKGYNYLNSSIECIERNVNPKFIFCDLTNRIYYNV